MGTYIRSTGDQSITLQQTFKSIEAIKIEPMDFDVEIRPMVPQFTYSNRKRYVKM